MHNPFEYDAAPNLDPKRLLDWYIEDHNYSRFMNARRNVIINGERGSGKSMTLIYHSLSYASQRKYANDTETGPVFGIYTACNTPLSGKEEHKLLEPVAQMRVAEANLVLSLVTNIAREMESVEDRLKPDDAASLRTDFAMALDADDFPEDVSPFKHLRREAHRKLTVIQRELQGDHWVPSNATDTFALVVMPILQAIRSTQTYQSAHFSLLVDDAQDLDPHQQRLVNSWLGYRDNSVFSLKVAVAGLRSYDLKTAFGGAVLEGHDFVTVDLQRPVQNRDSEFGQFARNVIAKRLANAGIKKSPEEFFPVSEAFAKRLEQARKRTEEVAKDKGLVPGSKAFADYVYKHRRAVYFRERDPKANKPTYSGFDTLTHLSTGVIRNLLQPCYFMFERQTAINRGKSPLVIASDVQDEVIKTQSDRLWEFVENSLHQRLPNCTVEDAKDIARLFTRLGEYFRERLLHHASEPRVVTFIISDRDHAGYPELNRLLSLAERAQILYVRPGTAKKGGGRESYYVPNRMLWPRYGLDAHGQHGRASLRAQDLWAAAKNNAPIPTFYDDTVQAGLFDGK